MKRLFTLLLLLSAGISSMAQSHLQWTTYENTPGSQTNIFEGTGVDKSGNVYTINFTQDPVNHYFTYRFFRYDNQGVKKWQYNNDSCFTNCMDKYNIIVPVDDGGAFFVGGYDDTLSVWQIRIKRIDLNGNLLWQQYWTGPYAFGSPVTARLDHAGNLVVALKAYVTIQQYEDFAIAKFDTISGNPIWHFEIPDGGGGSPFFSEIINGMDIGADNSIYCTGHAGIDNIYFKVTEAGTLDYQFVVQDNDSIEVLLSGGVVNMHLGNSNDLYLLVAEGTDTWVQKYDATTGSFLFRKTIQHDSATVVPVDFAVENNEIYALSNYNYFLPDSTFGGGHFTNPEFMITKIDTNGNTSWEKSFLENLDSMSLQNGYGGAVQIGLCHENIYVTSSSVLDSAGNYIVAVLTKIDTAGNIAWHDTTAEAGYLGHGVFGTDSLCNVYLTRSFHGVVTQKFSDQVTGVSEINNELVSFSIYPNPANSEINIEVAGKNNFEIDLINLLGETLLKEKNKNKIDVSSLPGGIYFLRLKQEENYYSRKFVKCSF